MVEFKKLKWGARSHLFKEAVYIRVDDPAPFEAIRIFLENREHTTEHYWEVVFVVNDEWTEEWGNLYLDPTYTTEEIQSFAQAGWEHYVTTNYFVSLS